ncbi:MAG: hypothetical protein ACLGI9_16845, partial [Thermoanaerobaculia bacterium]
VEIVPVFGAHRGRLDWIDAARVHLARWLYSGFIEKDVAFMDDMRFHPSAGGPADPVLDEFLEYLRQLPEETSTEEGFDETASTRRRAALPRARRAGGPDGSRDHP